MAAFDQGAWKSSDRNTNRIGQALQIGLAAAGESRNRSGGAATEVKRASVRVESVGNARARGDSRGTHLAIAGRGEGDRESGVRSNPKIEGAGLAGDQVTEVHAP